MEGFRLRGIYAESAASTPRTRWPGRRVPSAILPPIEGLIFGSPNGLTSERRTRTATCLRAWATKHRDLLGLDPKLPVTVPSFHPVFRTSDDGRLRVEMVVEIIQSRQATFDPGRAGGRRLSRSAAGVTLIVEAPEPEGRREGAQDALPPVVRFAIAKTNVGDELRAARADAAQLRSSQGLAAGDTTNPSHFQANFALLHEEF